MSEVGYIYTPRALTVTQGPFMLRDKLFNRQDGEVDIQPGERLDIPERTRDRSENLTPAGRRIRQKIDQRLKDTAVSPANDNIDAGTIVGAVGTAIVWLFEDYLPGRVAADAEIADVETVDGGIRYTVDSNAMIESQSRFRAILDSGTGITSLWTDEIEVQSIELVKARPVRDTYRYEIVVRS